MLCGNRASHTPPLECSCTPLIRFRAVTFDVRERLSKVCFRRLETPCWIGANLRGWPQSLGNIARLALPQSSKSGGNMCLRVANTEARDIWCVHRDTLRDEPIGRDQRAVLPYSSADCDACTAHPPEPDVPQVWLVRVEKYT